MKTGFIHLLFIIDESGSMYNSVADVKGGFSKLIEEQQAVKDGECAVTVYTFDNDVQQLFTMVNVNNLSGRLDYRPGGSTALYDGIGKAMTQVGRLLSMLKEDERPEKNIVVIMTDGEENSSRYFSADEIKHMIKEQTDKYNWSFIYTGADIQNFNDASSIGIRYTAANTRDDLANIYTVMSTASTNYRYKRANGESLADSSESIDNCLYEYSSESNQKYKDITGIDLTQNEKDESNQ